MVIAISIKIDCFVAITAIIYFVPLISVGLLFNPWHEMRDFSICFFVWMINKRAFASTSIRRIQVHPFDNFALRDENFYFCFGYC